MGIGCSFNSLPSEMLGPLLAESGLSPVAKVRRLSQVNHPCEQ